MMFKFRNLPINKKLILISMLSSGLALLLAGFVAVGLNWHSHTDAAKNRLMVLATVIGDRSQAALLFDDQKLVNENLSTLQYEPSVYRACLYNDSGKLAGYFIRDASESNRCKAQEERIDTPVPELWTATKLDISHTIKLDGTNIGTIWLFSDLKGVRELVWRDASIIGLVILLVSILALILGLRLQRMITSPIEKLAAATKKISTDFDFSIRVKKESKDELGALVDTFNEMLVKIEEQNDSLRIAKDSYFSLYHDNPMMLFTLKQNGVVLAVNEYGASQLGIKRDEVIGKGFSGLIVAQDRQVVVDMIQGCLLDDTNVHRSEIRHISTDDVSRWMRVTARVIRTASGEINILLVCEDITEQRNLSERLSFQASHDSLTGLVNRAEFERRLQSSLERLVADKGEDVLLYMDLDQFKVINDTCGHVAGDQMLRNLSVILAPEIRHSDTLARLGGDEFGVMLESCSLEQALTIGNNIIEVINNYEFYWEGKKFGLGISIGAVSYCNASQSVTDLMRLADAACYMAKDKGRNRIHVYETDDVELALRHGEMNWVSRIKSALSEDRLCLMRQPIERISMQEGKDGGHCEILVRMLDEDGSLIMPGAFLPAAERYNLSHRIDRWVVHNALKWFGNHPETIRKTSVVSLNLSGNTLNDEHFFDFLLKEFGSCPISAEHFCFEITETAAIANLDVAVNFITECRREFGCLFSLDDFGAGFSSFAYLKTLPVDYLKIDGQFVKDMLTNPVNMAMVKSINDIGKAMGKLTVAEFVEDFNTLRQLREMGVDYAQGYYVGKPKRLPT